MGLSIYVPLSCSHSKTYTDPFDLLQATLNFVTQQKSEKPVLVLMAQSGGGKSLFIVQLLRQLNQMIKSK
jgi:hypothetical protein